MGLAEERRKRGQGLLPLILLDFVGTVLESFVNTLPPWFISYPLKPHWKGKGERKGGEGEWR